jgi:nitrate reductase gamma subunit
MGLLVWPLILAAMLVIRTNSWAELQSSLTDSDVSGLVAGVAGLAMLSAVILLLARRAPKGRP